MVRILHIDDNATDRLLVKRELSRFFTDLQTHEIREAGEFEAALTDDHFDLAITDYQLGWSNGLSILHAIKSRFPACPVIMFTGTGNEEVAVEGMRDGLDDYVVKSPKHMIRLVTAVRSALEKVEARRRAAEAERERAESLQRERSARAEAERLLREAREAEVRKDEFLSMLAHELRNPLAPITNALHLLRQPELLPIQIHYAREVLERQVRHLGRLVDDLMDATRISRGRIELKRERLDFARLVREAIADYRTVVEANRLETITQVPSEPVWVRGDRTRLNQVVGNLLQNAVKFTDAGGRITIALVADSTTQEALLTIKDNGIGIESGLLVRVFEMFTQADQSLDRTNGGLGLGLALVKGLVELHGGRVSAASDGAGCGATFIVRIPLAPQEEAEHSDPTTRPSTAAATRVLIIEDNRDGAESLRMLLSLAGHEVQVAHTGPEGLKLARQYRPAVILCDLGLPGGMSGFDVARASRQDPVISSAKLIAISGYGQPEDQARARASGFDFHLTKPVDPDVLQQLFFRADSI